MEPGVAQEEGTVRSEVRVAERCDSNVAAIPADDAGHQLFLARVGVLRGDREQAQAERRGE